VQVILVRHGQAHRVESDEGVADPPLTDSGHLQAERLAAWLRRHERIDVLVVSPLLRARQTAQPIADRLGLVAQVVPELAEFDAGATSYIPVEELKATRHPRLRAMLDGEWTELGGAIDPERFRRSVVAAIDGLAARHPGETVLIVCHGAVINAYLGDVIGAPRVLWFEPRYTSLHRVLISRGGVRSVETLNEMAAS
jgi:probable phosphoglycerate mutase